MRKNVKLFIAIVGVLSTLIATSCSNSESSHSHVSSSTESSHSHVFSIKREGAEYLKTPADCTHPAVYYYSCECGEKGTNTFEYGEPLGHSFTNYVSDNNATHSNDGTKTAKCDRCDETDTMSDVGSMVPHTFDRQVTESRYLKTPADCTHPAVYYYSCECGEKGTQTFESGTPLGHHFSNGKCSTCDESIVDLTKNDLGKNELLTEDNGQNLSDLYDYLYSIFEDIYENVPDTIDNIHVDLSQFDLSFEEASSMVYRVICDQPLFYFVEQTFYYNIEENTLGINFADDYSLKSTRISKQKAIEDFISENSYLYGSSDFEILVRCHSLINDNVDYEYEGQVPSDKIHAHNILGVIEGEGAVCEGYSKTFHLLCNYFNIPAYFVTGLTNSFESHAWNLVKLEDEWYWCDLTWDDISCYGVYKWSASLYNCFTSRYEFFLQCDEDFIVTHMPDSNEFSNDRSYMYALPERAVNDYLSDHETSLFSYIEVDDVFYQIISSNEVSVVYIDRDGEYELPRSISHDGNTYNVVSIGTYFTGTASLPTTSMSFNKQSIVVVGPRVTSLIIPSSIRIILEHSLSSLSGVDGVESYYQNRLSNISVDSQNPYFCSVDGALYDKDVTMLIAYPFEKKDDAFIMPDSVLLCDSNALRGFSNLKEIRIGANFISTDMTNISAYLGRNNGKITVSSENPLFYDYGGFIYYLSNIYADFIPKRTAATILCASDVNRESYTILDKIETNDQIYYVDYLYVMGFMAWGDNCMYGVFDSIFGYLNNAKEIYSNNDLFRFDGFCLYYTDSILYARKDLEEIELNPDSDRIVGHAFNYYDSFKIVKIAEGIKYIEEGAFYMCHNIETVYLPSTIETIGAYIFVHDFALRDIYYCGTKDDWNNVDLDENWLLDSSGAIIHCSNGDIDLRNIMYL